MGSKYGNYSPDSRTSSKNKGTRVHPVWRGVGFAMMILIPIMAYASMKVLMEQNDIHGWIPLTNDMLAKPGELLYMLIPDPLLYVKLVLFLLCVFVFFTLFTLISFIINAMFGVSRKDDPFYVPPVRRTKLPPKRYHNR
jgi:hypothetical protein